MDGAKVPVNDAKHKEEEERTKGEGVGESHCERMFYYGYNLANIVEKPTKSYLNEYPLGPIDWPTAFARA